MTLRVRGFGSVIQKCKHFCATLTLHTLDGDLADGAFVLDGVALCPRRVDDEVHLLVQDDVEDVRATFSNLVHHFALDTGCFVELGGAFGSVNLEAELLELLADFDSVLHVHEAANVESFGNLAGIILNGCQVFLRDGHRRDNAGGVTGVDTGKFDVFHHGRDVDVFAVGEGVGFAFESVVEEAVDEP